MPISALIVFLVNRQLQQMSGTLQQEQQGFYPSLPIVNSLPNQNPLLLFQKPIDYQSRVFASANITHNLPVQMIQPFADIPLLNDPSRIIQENDQQNISRQQAKSPYDKYISSCSYKLIYNKNNINFQSDEDFVKREIDLSYLQAFSSYNFVTLMQQRLQQIATKLKDQSSLVFNSSFQCGNLFCVYQSLKEQNSYECLVQRDTNTQGYNQWFCFSIQNMRKDVNYKFKIVNLSKRFSFFKLGMKVILFSYQRHKKVGNGWFQRGYRIRYQPSDIYDIKQGEKVKLYSLSFELDFDYSFDYVTLSLGVPYSYTRLLKQLKIFKSNSMKNNIIWEQQALCHTISNNVVPYLTISKNSHVGSQHVSQQPKKAKKIIIMMARQHPGETNGSFIMEKILQLLSCNQNQKINWLLDKYQFRVFPMVNVDGVIYGNYRCDLVGLDLNRCWRNPIAELHPQVSAIKKQIENLRKDSKIAICIDFHSHSKQFNVFSYCNKYDEIQSRLFSMILSKKCPFFHFPYCTFGLSKEKQSTARAIIGLSTQNQNALTIQFSAFGYKSQGTYVMFNNQSFQITALAILASLKCFFSNNKEKKMILNEIQDNLPKIRSYCRKNIQIQSGSQSDHIAELEELSQKLKVILPKELVSNIKKRLKYYKITPQKRNNEQSPALQKQSKVSTPKQNIQIRLNFQRKPINEVKNNERKRQIQILAKKNIDKQVIFDLSEPSWKLSQRNQRIKTDPKYSQQTGENPKKSNNIRYSTPNKVIEVNKTDFKHSLKMLCKELNTTAAYRQQQDLTLTVSNVKAASGKQKYERNNKLQHILKVRRRASNFKNIISREPPIEEKLTLLKIRSDYSQSTMEILNQNISSPTAANSKIDKFLPSKEHFSNNYVSHISFLNKFLKTNIKDTMSQKKRTYQDDVLQ